MGFTSGFELGSKARKAKQDALTSDKTGADRASSTAYKVAQTEELEQKIVSQGMEIQFMKNNMAGQVITQATDNFIQGGSFEDFSTQVFGNEHTKNIMKNKYGVNNVASLNWESDKHLQLLSDATGLDIAELQDFSKEDRGIFNNQFGISYTDKGMHVTAISDFLAQTGYLNKTTSGNAKAYLNSLESLKRVGEKRTEIHKNYTVAKDNGYTGTFVDFLKMPKTPAEQKTAMDIQASQTASSIYDYIVKDELTARTNVFTGANTETINIGGKEYSKKDIAMRKEKATIDVKGKLGQGRKDELSGKAAVVQGADRILEKVKKIKDWDITTKVQKEVEKVTGNFFTDLVKDFKGKTPEEKAKLAEEAALKLKGMQKDLVADTHSRQFLEAYVFPVLADYIKAMSGAAVTEEERSAYVENMTAGWMANKQAFVSSITGFRASVNDALTVKLEQVAEEGYWDFAMSKGHSMSATATTSGALEKAKKAARDAGYVVYRQKDGTYVISKDGKTFNKLNY